MNADQYRARAGEFEHLAAAALPELRVEYEKLARAWRELAKTAEDLARRQKAARP